MIEIGRKCWKISVGIAVSAQGSVQGSKHSLGFTFIWRIFPTFHSTLDFDHLGEQRVLENKLESSMFMPLHSIERKWNYGKPWYR